MSNEALVGMVVALFGLTFTLLASLIALVWRASATVVSHSFRLTALEHDVQEVVELRKHLWTLDRRSEVRAARASAGQFDQGNSDAPKE